MYLKYLLKKKAREQIKERGFLWAQKQRSAPHGHSLRKEEVKAKENT